jgi:hypothetical protein
MCRVGEGIVSEQPPTEYAPPGWFPDPTGLQALRWWDGTQWGQQTRSLPGNAQQSQPQYQPQQPYGHEQPYPGQPPHQGTSYGQPYQQAQPYRQQPGAPSRHHGRPPRKSWPQRHKVLTALGGLGALIIIGSIAAAAVGGSGPATVRVHGSFDIDFASSNPNCVSGGDQVMITDASGKVLATATLPATPVTKKITVQGIQVAVEEYTYSATVPVEPRYGLTVGSLSPYYVTEAQFIKGTDLSC